MTAFMEILYRIERDAETARSLGEQQCNDAALSYLEKIMADCTLLIKVLEHKEIEHECS